MGSIPDFGDTFGTEAGQNKRRAGPDVRCEDRATGEVVHSPDDGVLGLNRDIGAHTRQLADITKTGVVEILGDN